MSKGIIESWRRSPQLLSPKSALRQSSFSLLPYRSRSQTLLVYSFSPRFLQQHQLVFAPSGRSQQPLTLYIDLAAPRKPFKLL